VWGHLKKPASEGVEMDCDIWTRGSHGCTSAGDFVAVINAGVSLAAKTVAATASVGACLNGLSNSGCRQTLTSRLEFCSLVDAYDSNGFAGSSESNDVRVGTVSWNCATICLERLSDACSDFDKSLASGEKAG